MDRKTTLLVLMAFLLGISAVFLWSQMRDTVGILNSKSVKEIPVAVSPIPASLPDADVSSSTLFSSPSVSTPTLYPNPFSTWTTYSNNTLKYRFLYDPVWNLATQSNSISVQGDVSNVGWPSINVIKLMIAATDISDLKAQVENMFSEATTQVSIGSNIPTVLLATAASPQSYAGKNYYFLHHGNTLLISLNDTGHAEADQIYQYFLDNFEIY